MENNLQTQLNNLPNDPIQKNSPKKTKRNFWKYLNYFLIAVPVIILFSFFLYFFDLKQAYAYITSGRNNLEAVTNLTKSYDIENALEISKRAENNFKLAYNKINNVENGLFIKFSPYLKDQLANLNLIVETSILISNSSNIGLELAQEFKSILDNPDQTIENLENTKKSQILHTLNNSQQDLEKISTNINQGVENLEQVKYDGLLWPLRNKITQIYDKLVRTQEITNTALPFAQVLPGLAGLEKEAHYLVLYQNNDRLRPIGGTIGTYGLIHVKDGIITDYELYDAVHLDRVTKNQVKITPPLALQKYAKEYNWKMQDANWSPDWTIAALNVEKLYKAKIIEANKQENINGTCNLEDCMLKIDGIIALTPELTKDLLDIIGGIIVDEVEYNRDNFTRLFEDELKQEYARLGKTHLRKELINKITQETHLKLFDLEYTNWPEVAKVFHKHTMQKNILVYAKDKKLQDIIETQSWSGKINKENNDFLMVVDTNLPATRINDNIKQTLDYNIHQDGDKLTAKLDINYTYVKNLDSRTYKDYVRIYVPLGSKLLSSNGTKSEIITNTDLGKTVFEGYLEVRPGTNHTLHLEYELPNTITPELVKNYQLYIQKQPGKNIDNVKVNLELTGQIQDYNNSSIKAEKISDNKILWKTDLIVDRIFKANSK